MRVRVAESMVFDGQVPQPVAGSVMAAVGVRAYCWALRQGPPVSAAVRELARSESDGHEHAYEICGTAGPARDFSSDSASGPKHAGAKFVLRAGACRFLASTEGHASDVVPGSVHTVRCTLELVADDEWDAFDLPDVRADWHVVSVDRTPRSDGTEPDHLVDLRALTS